MINPDATHPRQTIADLIEIANHFLTPHSETPRLDAEVLLCHCLEQSRTFLRAWPNHPLSPEQLNAFWKLIGERHRGIPVAHLTGYREFWSREFFVNANVLIPRPDTELLVELTLDRLAPNIEAKIIDLGTGSGALAITIALERPRLLVTACDLSDSALAIARLNAQRLNAKQVSFIHSDWFSHIAETDFDIVLSNPPYIAEDDPHLMQGDLRFEPRNALVAEEKGLSDIDTLAKQSRSHLKPNGHLLIEHGYDQQHAVQAIFKHYGYHQTTTHHDLSGNPRVTSGIWNPA